MHSGIEQSAQGSVRIVTITQPKRRNAVTLAMWEQLGRVFQDFDRQREVRSVVIRGAGADFSSGADISEFAAIRYDSESGEHYDAIADAALVSMRRCSKPVIAAISGYALGGGASIALACDFRVMERTARVAIPAARLGVVYSAFECSLLTTTLGPVNAKKVLFSGTQFSGEDCSALGLADVLVDEGAAFAAAMEWASDFARSAPISVRGHKLAINALADGTLPQHLDELRVLTRQAFSSEDYREGRRAFAEKRKPKFGGS